MRRLARENPDARIYVTGCYAVSDPEASADLLKKYDERFQIERGEHDHLVCLKE